MKHLSGYTIRRVIKFTYFLPLLALLLSAQNSYSQANDVVTNQTVVRLQKAGISNDVIAAKINNSPCSFDLSVDGIIALKRDSVNDDIIKVMLARGSTVAPAQSVPVQSPPVQSVPVQTVTPSVKTPAEPVQDVTAAQNAAKAAELKLAPGLYYFDPETNEYTEIDPVPLAKSSDGVGSKVTGLFNGKSKMALRGVESNLTVGAGKPMFVFVFDTGNAGGGRGRTITQNPNDYFLVQFEVGKGDREIIVKKSGGDGFERGVDDSAKVPFHYKRIQKGLYEVTASSPMPSGEFCFILPSTASDQSVTYNAYDFSVQ